MGGQSDLKSLCSEVINQGYIYVDKNTKLLSCIKIFLFCKMTDKPTDQVNNILIGIRYLDTKNQSILKSSENHIFSLLLRIDGHIK